MESAQSCINISQSVLHPVADVARARARSEQIILASYQPANYAFSANIYRCEALTCQLCKLFPLSYRESHEYRKSRISNDVLLIIWNVLMEC